MARDLDFLSIPDRTLIDFHNAHIKELESELRGKEIELATKQAQTIALSQISALVGTGIKAQIQKAIDAGDLRNTWDKLVADMNGDVVLTVGRLLIYNTDECMDRIRTQAQIEQNAMLEYRGTIIHIRQEMDKTRASIESIWTQHERRVRMAAMASTDHDHTNGSSARGGEETQTEISPNDTESIPKVEA